MDNLDLTEKRPIMIYTIPVPKGEETRDTEFFDRDYPDVTITNFEFVKNIDKVANSLVALGVKKGDVVTICQTNTPEMFYMDYALNKIGALPNFIYPNVTAEEMRYYIDELNSKYLFILDDEPIRKNVKIAIDNTDIKVISSTVIESFPTLFKIIASKKAPKSITKIENEIKWNAFIKAGKNHTEIESGFTPNSPYCFMHTSGTSSVPKAVIMSNENVNCTPYNYAVDGAVWEAHCVAVQTIPNFVAYGVTTTHHILCNNICVVYIPEMDPKNYYDLINKYHPHYSFATPSHARELIKRPTDMSNCKIFGFGGDGFDDIELRLNDYIIKNGGTICALQGYGSTEMSAVALVNVPNKHKTKSLGYLSGDTKAVIIEPGTFNEITEPNKIGELCLTGPGLTLGYAGNSKEETEKVYIKHPDGLTYVHMGDYISRDEDGFFYYHGRIKNVITRKSFTFSPDEIVKAICKHENVKQCVVVPKYSKEEGETPSAHIVLNDYSDVSKNFNEILSLVNENVQEFHRPTDYTIRKSIPLTRNNKNNIIALKIEDTAKLCPLVSDALIIPQTTGELDYVLKVWVNEGQDNIKKTIFDFIKEVSNFVKFDMGKLNLEIYTDDKSENTSYII